MCARVEFGGDLVALLRMFFSFKGRLRRRDYWLCNLALAVVTMALAFLVVWGLKIQPDDPRFDGLTLIVLWPSIALLVKRIHDRDKTGWMAANYWVPALVSMGLGWLSDPEFAVWKVFIDIGAGMVALWYLIEFGFMDGSQGRNAYGPSPKGVERSEKVAEVFT